MQPILTNNATVLTSEGNSNVCKLPDLKKRPNENSYCPLVLPPRMETPTKRPILSFMDRRGNDLFQQQLPTLSAGQQPD